MCTLRCKNKKFLNDLDICGFLLSSQKDVKACLLFFNKYYSIYINII